MNTQQLHRAVLGVCNLSDLFDDIKMFRYVVTPKRGSYIDKPAGYCFVASVNSVPQIDGKGWALCGLPKDKVRNTASYYMCEGPVRSFKIIPWKDQGVALVTCTDKTLIPSTWLAFIPLDQVPDGLKLDKVIAHV